MVVDGLEDAFAQRASVSGSCDLPIPSGRNLDILTIKLEK